MSARPEIVSAPVRRVLAALEARGSAGRLATVRGGWVAACPAHADPAAALSLKQGGDGRAMLRCAAGCDFAAVNAALGLTPADLFPPKDRAPAAAAERMDDASATGELAVLGAVLVGIRLGHADFLADVRGVLRSEDVEDPAIRAVFDAIGALADEGATLTVPGIRLRAQAVLPGADPLTVINAAFDFSDDIDADATMDAAKALRERADARRYAAVLSAEAAAVRSGQTSPVAARTRVASAGEAIVDASRKRRSRFTFYTDLELAARPPMRWLVPDMLPTGALAAVIGAPEVGKSFVVLDLCASIATGRPFLGRPVDGSGPVLYIAAEGGPGLAQRSAAWRTAFGDGLLGPDEHLGVWFTTEGADLTTPADVEEVLLFAAELPAPPALIVFDTLARSMPGADENSAQEVGRVLHHAAMIQRATGACVLLVHHTTKDGDSPRGSSSTLGAVDTMWLVRDEDGRRILSCAKQKDGPHFDPQYLDLSPVELPNGATSCVIVAASAEPAPPTPDTLSPQQRQALLTLSRDFLTTGATASEWQKASRVPEGSFYRVRAALVKAGFVAEPAEAGRSGARYRITPNGERALILSNLPSAGRASATSTPTVGQRTANPAGARSTAPHSVEGSTAGSVRPSLSVAIGHSHTTNDSHSRGDSSASGVARGSANSSWLATRQGKASQENKHLDEGETASAGAAGAAALTERQTAAASTRDSRRDSESESGAAAGRPLRVGPIGAPPHAAPPPDDDSAPEWVFADPAA